MAQAYQHKRKAKAKRALIMIEAPEEFHKDCQILTIHFEKLQPKVKWIFDKWIKEINPITAKPYPELMVSKWIRAKMKEAKYSPEHITYTIKRIAPHLIGKQGPRNFRKSKISDVTAAQQQANGMPNLPSRKSLKHDLASYDFEKRGQIILYLWGLIEKQKVDYETQIETLRSQLAKHQHHNSKFLSYAEASEYVRKHRIDTVDAWREHTQSEKFTHNIPVHPERHYSEWAGWKRFAGLDKATLQEKQRKGAEITNKVFNHFIEINAEQEQKDEEEKQ